MSASTVTTYPTPAARREAVARARDRKMDAFAALESALEAGDHAAAKAANDALTRTDHEYRRVLTEEWRTEEAQ